MNDNEKKCAYITRRNDGLEVCSNDMNVCPYMAYVACEDYEEIEDT